MKLYYAPASPYVRKVMILLHETGLEPGVERISSATTPMKSDTALRKSNPLMKLPALILDSGETLYDSRVICEYLDTTFAGGRFFPAAPMTRWTALRRQSLADGLLDAGLIVRYETKMRPPEKLWEEWRSGQWAKVTGAATEMEHEAPQFGGSFDIGTIAIACALGYLDFRYPEFDWRDDRPVLAAWFAKFSERPSLQKTVPTLQPAGR